MSIPFGSLLGYSEMRFIKGVSAEIPSPGIFLYSSLDGKLLYTSSRTEWSILADVSFTDYCEGSFFRRSKIKVGQIIKRDCHCLVPERLDETYHRTDYMIVRKDSKNYVLVGATNLEVCEAITEAGK